MCRRVECNACGLPTFAGCGMHVEQVLGDVPRTKRCRCGEEDAVDPTDASTLMAPAERSRRA